ncbi:NmrA-like protein [Niveomyces insectorum RCEF 264]|uniref:NmrA-like protein n=1 Tax=Niveomyces insectorum RCEF 264 TaxID=1081102 RepID=A0A167Y4S8_9HYPO|nr:NmrA-like protein [Niveomyces insectorum RCEF 264]
MASFVPTRLLIVGATGAIGRYITEAILAAKPPFTHVAIFTSPNTVTNKADLLQTWKARGLASVVVGSVQNEDDVQRAYTTEKPDTVISCLGRDALQVQESLLRLADAPGSPVKWVFPSEYGTDVEHNPSSATEKPHQHKLALRKYIREQIKNVQVTYLVTGPYFDMWVNYTPDTEPTGGFDPAAKRAVVVGDGEGRVGFCTMPDVGKFLVASLRHPEASFGKALKVQSFVVTPNQVLAEYERQTNAKWTVTSTPLPLLKELEAKAWAAKSPKATSFTLRRIWAEGGTLYDKNDNEVIGIKPGDADSLETAVRRALGK